MDKAALLGLLGGGAIVAWSIWVAGASYTAFWDSPSAIMVVGGTIASALTAFPMRALVNLPRVARKAVFARTREIEPVIRQFVEFAEIARRDGILSLEHRLDDVDDPFLKLGLQLVIDGTDPGVTESILRSEMTALAGRHRNGKFLFETLNKFAPAWGMTGTLVGLVIMLGNMADPNSIGPGMAVALLTTLYGALLSNVVCSPIVDKLVCFSRWELEAREIMLRGILSIQVGDNPRILEQKLRTFLAPDERRAISARAA
jgi:chemotaxis protein MotA